MSNALLMAGFIFHTAGQLPAVTPYVTYTNGELRLLVKANEIVPLLNKALDQAVPKTVKNTDTEEVTVKNFRCSFANGSIRVRFDYKARRRGWTKVFNAKVYSPWASDSGWVEVDVRAIIHDGVFSSWTRNGNVRWESNNWATRLLADVADQQVRDSVANSFNDAIRAQIPGGSKDLRPLLVEQGAQPVAQSLGIPKKDAAKLLRTAVQKTHVEAFVDSYGINGSLKLDPSILASVNKPGGGGSGNGGKPNIVATIQVTFTNRTNSTVPFSLNGGNGLKTSLAPGKTGSYKMVVEQGKAPSVRITQSNGGVLPFTVKNGEEYEFQLQNGKIVNAYKQRGVRK